MFDTEKVGSRLILTLNRPPVNAINDEWLERFHTVMDGLESDDETTVLHFRSAQRIFCAGMDAKHIISLTERADGAEAMVKDVTLFQKAFARLEALPIVTIAELGGATLGGGLELALACDLRIASHRAKIGLPEANLGLIPGAGGTQRLTWLCGRGVASRLILSGDVVDGATAERLGIVQWSFPPEKLTEEADAIAARIANLSPYSLREAKKLIAAALDDDRDGYREEIEADRALFSLEYTHRRIRNFLAGNR
jgi:enoyl-CoA hydratase/carnithine racemase